MHDSELHLETLRRDLTALELPPGVGETAVPGLITYRYERELPLSCSAGLLSLSLIVSGRKSVLIGAREIVYGAGEALLSGAAVPSAYRPLGATPEHPFLAVVLRLDRSILLEMAAKLPVRPPCSADSGDAVFVFRPEEDLLVDLRRLVRLLQTPELIALRAPAIIRDIHALVLSGPAAGGLLPLLEESAPACTVVRAIDWLQTHYRESVSIEDLARAHNMSTSNFHRRFKAVTGLSPLQYQKQIRLAEAQRLLLSNRARVAEAAYAVGYESPTQFVREYKRRFGDSPMRDVRRRRELALHGGLNAQGPLSCPSLSAQPAAA